MVGSRIWDPPDCDPWSPCADGIGILYKVQGLLRIGKRREIYEAGAIPIAIIRPPRAGWSVCGIECHLEQKKILDVSKFGNQGSRPLWLSRGRRRLKGREPRMGALLAKYLACTFAGLHAAAESLYPSLKVMKNEETCDLWRRATSRRSDPYLVRYEGMEIGWNETMSVESRGSSFPSRSLDRILKHLRSN